MSDDEDMNDCIQTQVPLDPASSLRNTQAAGASNGAKQTAAEVDERVSKGNFMNPTYKPPGAQSWKVLRRIPQMLLAKPNQRKMLENDQSWFDSTKNGEASDLNMPPEILHSLKEFHDCQPASVDDSVAAGERKMASTHQNVRNDAGESNKPHQGALQQRTENSLKSSPQSQRVPAGKSQIQMAVPNEVPETTEDLAEADTVSWSASSREGSADDARDENTVQAGTNDLKTAEAVPSTSTPKRRSMDGVQGKTPNTVETDNYDSRSAGAVPPLSISREKSPGHIREKGPQTVRTERDGSGTTDAAPWPSTPKEKSSIGTVQEKSVAASQAAAAAEYVQDSARKPMTPPSRPADTQLHHSQRISPLSERVAEMYVPRRERKKRLNGGAKEWLPFPAA